MQKNKRAGKIDWIFEGSDKRGR